MADKGADEQPPSDRTVVFNRIEQAVSRSRPIRLAASPPTTATTDPPIERRPPPPPLPSLASFSPEANNPWRVVNGSQELMDLAAMFRWCLRPSFLPFVCYTCWGDESREERPVLGLEEFSGISFSRSSRVKLEVGSFFLFLGIIEQDRKLQDWKGEITIIFLAVSLRIILRSVAVVEWNWRFFFLFLRVMIIEQGRKCCKIGKVR